ncbi:hypothetical protein QKU48_gp1012 [Fadolivirus algeromassiliense]|jgi:hypothetical protein|uniref:Uncharacterized protein n=1 Tax=Fadolivirus FV1/VV64 TaxID=3070911 RepID=A0A7D3UTQ2_9VIRU|nr:hypothetical protein QKU48_gp1012 [Fadolivirus algeromassiliense]QKF94470.1 hypothetical protein Fadolivirus_1_1012 [Fadolivirus FV1/VV64]
MGNIFNKSNNEINEDKEVKQLTDLEREEIAKKRVEYINKKYLNKPFDKTKKFDISDKSDKRHEQYIRDWLN